MADGAGTVAERYAYAAYGEVKYLDASYAVRAGSNYAWGYLYTGRYLDSVSGLHYYRNRMHHSKLGRFCSRDPVWYQGAPQNLYDYVDSAPATKHDSTGLAPDADFAHPFRYGEYCGPSKRASCVPSPGGGLVPDPRNEPPIDLLDAACEAHDCCMSSTLRFVMDMCFDWYGCNTAFCASLAAINCAAMHPRDPAQQQKCNNMLQRATNAFC